MQNVRWNSTTYDARGHIKTSSDDIFRNYEQRREAKMVQLETWKRGKVAKLSKYGLKCFGSDKEYKDGDDDDDDEEEEGKKDYTMKYFKKGMERRKLSLQKSTKCKLKKEQKRFDNLVKNDKKIFEKEYGRSIRAHLREDRVGMKIADLESKQFEKILDDKIDIQLRFQKSCLFLEDKMKHGFRPNQSYGRNLLFGRLGLNKKIKKIQVQK